MAQPPLSPLSKDDDSEYMNADREFFEQHPHKDFYVRKRFAGESMPNHPPHVIVAQVAPGVRYRFPCFKDSISQQDLAEIQKELQANQALTKLKSSMQHQKKTKKKRKDKSKGFGNA